MVTAHGLRRSAPHLVVAGILIAVFFSFQQNATVATEDAAVFLSAGSARGSADTSGPHTSGLDHGERSRHISDPGHSPAAPGHWAFTRPRRPAVPQVTDRARVRNPIDAFVIAGLEARGWSLSPRADTATLARRLTLALTGVPPTPAEAAALEADPGSAAYDRAVERLLASPQHAEHLARWWLDQARFADTDGYHIDGHRDVWKWRDWVIDAFARNKRFDVFTIEQLAGDLLENRTLDQLVATGFNRNHMTNIEGGADPEEYATRYVVDRVNTTSTVWLGLTMKCAECHDHKYDPIPQKDYYRLYAFFDNIPERGLDGYYGNAPPFIPVPTPAEKVELDRLNRALFRCQQRLDALEPGLAAAQAAWEQRMRTDPIDPDVRDGLVLHYELEGLTDEATPEVASKTRGAVVSGAGSASWPAGRLGRAVRLDGIGTHLECGPVVDFDRGDAFSLGAWVEIRNGGTVVSKLREEGGLRGFDLAVLDGRVRLILAHGPGDVLEVATRSEIDPRRWRHVLATYDGSGTASGVRLYVDGEPQAVEVLGRTVAGAIRCDQPLRIGRREVEQGYQGLIDDVRCYDRALTAGEAARLAQQPVLGILAVAPGKRTAAQRAEVATYFAERVSAEASAIHRELLPLQRKARKMVEKMPQAMIMAELPTPRPTHVLEGGDYRRKGDLVTAGVPTALPALPAGKPGNRLALAEWLVDPANPLTARVLVNRLWAELFGAGLVETSEDFGTRGSAPTHPRLLDWLAVEFVESGWDLRHMLRLMVGSAAFRQASTVAPARHAADPQNRSLWRMNRVRLDAEEVRDNALAIADLLDRRVGGASVQPFQPPGLWDDLAFGGGFPGQDYEPSVGADLYRRGLYVYWKRSAPYASFQIFDAPTRELCAITRDRTNTPLQALVLLNDPVYVEAARAFAVRILTSAPDSGAADADDARLRFALRASVARAPRPGELAVLRSLLATQRRRLRADPEAARQLLAVGPFRAPTTLKVDATELAAWTMVGSAMLNTSEVITRP